MYEACERAKVSIDIEQYIFEDDPQGRQFLDMLSRQAQQGVAVRLLCDMVGSYSLYGSRTLFEAERSGVQVRFFNTIKPWWAHKLFTWFLRTHRKLLVVDGATGLIGGVGIRAYKSERRDTHVQVTGPVVTQFTKAFERMWEMTAREKRSFGFARPEGEPGEFTLLTNSPHFRQRFTYRALVERFLGAQRFIYVTTPYFIPDGRLFRALRRAARRGVDVRVLLPKDPDWRPLAFGNHSFYSRALRSGIRIFEYGPGFIHSKTYVVDDRWASVGSSNLDSLSLLFNYEADLASTSSRFVAELKGQFLNDLRATQEVSRVKWHQRSFWQKCREQFFRPFHRFM